MKLSLDELKVDSYAVQVSETELTEIKGGTAWLCVDLGLAVATLAIAGYAAWKSSGSPSGGSSTTSGAGSGAGTTVFYGVDSVKVGGVTYYGIDSLQVNN